jgi:hypothetical protein
VDRALAILLDLLSPDARSILRRVGVPGFVDDPPSPGVGCRHDLELVVAPITPEGKSEEKLPKEPSGAISFLDGHYERHHHSMTYDDGLSSGSVTTERHFGARHCPNSRARPPAAVRLCYVADAVDSIIEHLKEHLIDDQTERPSGMTFRDLCNEVALRVARRFHAGTLAWEDGDLIMNSVWDSIMNTLIFDVPDGNLFGLDSAIAVFEAFDQGEFIRDGDDRDPADVYTVPLIREFLEELDSRP